MPIGRASELAFLPRRDFPAVTLPGRAAGCERRAVQRGSLLLARGTPGIQTYSRLVRTLALNQSSEWVSVFLFGRGTESFPGSPGPAAR